jgi:membrane-associated phospholipid phosphatase
VKSSFACSRRFWLWLLAGAGVVTAAFLWDNRVDAALNVTHVVAWEHFARGCSKIGEGWVIAVVGIFFALVFLLVQRPQVAARIFFVALTSELTGLAATILRVLFGRTRPTAYVPQGFYGVWHDGHWIIGKYDFSSFPSGHAATAVGLAAAYALAVVWSRMALQCHHLSDVLASAVLSIALAVWLKPLLLPPLESQFGRLHRIGRGK